MKSLFIAVAAVLALNACTVAPVEPSAASLDDDLELFLQWFPGEYDNYEQHWQDKIDNVEQVHEHIHHIFFPVNAAAIGQHTFFVQQYMDGDPDNIYRQRLYSFSQDNEEQAIRLDIFSYKDEAKYRDAHLNPGILAGISQDELVARPGCEVFWKFKGDYFGGYMKDKACAVKSRRSGKMIYVTDDLKLTPDEIWIRDEAFYADGSRVFGNEAGIHHKNRKVQYYSGWAAVSRKGPTMALEESNWTDTYNGWEFTGELDTFSRMTIHNEGQILPISDDEGEPTGYSVQLARLTQQSSRVEVLVLKIIDDATGRALAYSWGKPGATRLGVNSRWAQSGVTLNEGNASWGFAVAD